MKRSTVITKAVLLSRNMPKEANSNLSKILKKKKLSQSEFRKGKLIPLFKSIKLHAVIKCVKSSSPQSLFPFSCIYNVLTVCFSSVEGDNHLLPHQKEKQTVIILTAVTGFFAMKECVRSNYLTSCQKTRCSYVCFLLSSQRAYSTAFSNLSGARADIAAPQYSLLPSVTSPQI